MHIDLSQNSSFNENPYPFFDSLLSNKFVQLVALPAGIGSLFACFNRYSWQGRSIVVVNPNVSILYSATCGVVFASWNYLINVGIYINCTLYDEEISLDKKEADKIPLNFFQENLQSARTWYSRQVKYVGNQIHQADVYVSSLFNSQDWASSKKTWNEQSQLLTDYTLAIKYYEFFKDDDKKARLQAQFINQKSSFNVTRWEWYRPIIVEALKLVTTKVVLTSLANRTMIILGFAAMPGSVILSTALKVILVVGAVVCEIRYQTGSRVANLVIDELCSSESASAFLCAALDIRGVKVDWDEAFSILINGKYKNSLMEQIEQDLRDNQASVENLKEKDFIDVSAHGLSTTVTEANSQKKVDVAGEWVDEDEARLLAQEDELALLRQQVEQMQQLIASKKNQVDASSHEENPSLEENVGTLPLKRMKADINSRSNHGPLDQIFDSHSDSEN